MSTRMHHVNPASRGASTSSPAVDISRIRRCFSADVTAVDDVTLSVDQGELLCLLGPSGSGKTTLLRIVGGFDQADSGTVRLMGEDVTRRPPAQRRTNMVFQNHALFPHLNVHDNIAFGPRMRKVPEDQIAQRVAQVLELVRLPGYASRGVDQLSGGQRQRVAIARALINDPEVLLLDEPLGALDLRLRMELQEELRRLQRSLGRTFIVVTHDQHEAMAMSDRIAVMNAGRIEQVGTPDEIYHRPASLFVAQFIGHTNLLKGRLCADALGHGRAVEIAGVKIPCQFSGRASPGEQIALSIREELVRVMDPEVLDGRVDFQAEGIITDRSFLGAQIRYGVRINDALLLFAEVGADGSPTWSIGNRVRVGWRVAQVPVFRAS